MTTRVSSTRSGVKTRDVTAAGWAVLGFVVSLVLLGLGLYQIATSPGLSDPAQRFPRLVIGVVLFAAGLVIVARYGRLLSALFGQGDYQRARDTMRIDLIQLFLLLVLAVVLFPVVWIIWTAWHPPCSLSWPWSGRADHGIRTRGPGRFRPTPSPLRGHAVFRRTRSVVGLDIGSSAVKAVELKPAGKSYRVAAFGVEPIPPDRIVDGTIIDGAAVADAIRRLFDGRGIKTKEVAASLSGNAVIVKKIALPPMSEAELADAIYWEAEQYNPFDVQDVNLDYQVVSGPNGHKAPGASNGGLEVLLVAAHKTMPIHDVMRC